MSFAKTVIAPRVGGIPGFVRNGETGLLVSPDDPAALVKAMIRLDRDDLLRVSLAGRGYESATKEHSWDCVVDAYQAAYAEILRGSDHIRPAVETPLLPR